MAGGNLPRQSVLGEFRSSTHWFHGARHEHVDLHRTRPSLSLFAARVRCCSACSYPCAVAPIIGSSKEYTVLCCANPFAPAVPVVAWSSVVLQRVHVQATEVRMPADFHMTPPAQHRSASAQLSAEPRETPRSLVEFEHNARARRRHGAAACARTVQNSAERRRCENCGKVHGGA